MTDTKTTSDGESTSTKNTPPATKAATGAVVDPKAFGWHTLTDDYGSAYVKELRGTVMAIFSKDLLDKTDPIPFEINSLDLTDHTVEYPARRSAIADSLPVHPFGHNPPLKGRTDKVRRCSSYSTTPDFERFPNLTVTVADSTDLELLQMKETYMHHHTKPGPGLQPKIPKSERPYTNDHQAKVKTKESTNSVVAFDAITDTLIPKYLNSLTSGNASRFGAPHLSVTKLWKSPLSGRISPTFEASSHYPYTRKTKLVPPKPKNFARQNQGSSSLSPGQQLKPNISNRTGESKKHNGVFEARMREMLKQEKKQHSQESKPPTLTPAKKSPKVSNFGSSSMRSRSLPRPRDSSKM